MIQPVPQGLESPFDFRKVEEPTGLGIDPPFAHKLNSKAVTMKSGTLVPGWGIRQAVRRLELELSNKSNLVAHLSAGRIPLALGRVDLLISYLLDHTACAIRATARSPQFRQGVRTWYRIVDLMIANPPTLGMIHDCNIIRQRIRWPYAALAMPTTADNRG